MGSSPAAETKPKHPPEQTHLPEVVQQEAPPPICAPDIFGQYHPYIPTSEGPPPLGSPSEQAFDREVALDEGLKRLVIDYISDPKIFDRKWHLAYVTFGQTECSTGEPRIVLSQKGLQNLLIAAKESKGSAPGVPSMGTRSLFSWGHAGDALKEGRSKHWAGALTYEEFLKVFRQPPRASDQ